MDRRRFLSYGSHALSTALFVPHLLGQGQLTAAPSALTEMRSDRPLRNLAFGSCNDTSRDQRYWNLILREKPDLWLSLGDNIYADGLTMEGRRALYRHLKETPAYRNFRENVPILGTWDDHDYASDNQDGNFPDKWQSKEAFREFFDLSLSRLPEDRAGVYQSYSFGLPGQRTQLIILDLRFHMQRASLSRQLLGDEQWTWLESEISEKPANLLLIGSSLNFSSPIVGLGLEGWQEYPQERRRLLMALDAAQKPTIILSGDRHFAEISRVTLPSGLPVYELMSSGLTHAAGLKLPHPGRLGEIVGLKNYGQLLIDWSDVGPSVRLGIRSTEGYGLLREQLADFAYRSA